MSECRQCLQSFNRTNGSHVIVGALKVASCVSKTWVHVLVGPKYHLPPSMANGHPSITRTVLCFSHVSVGEGICMSKGGFVCLKVGVSNTKYKYKYRLPPPLAKLSHPSINPPCPLVSLLGVS